MLKKVFLFLLLSIFLLSSCSKKQLPKGKSPKPADSTNYQYQGNPQRSGEFKAVRAPLLNIKWKVDISRYGNYLNFNNKKDNVLVTSPVSDNKSVYVGVGKKLIAFDMDGNLVWEKDIAKDVKYNSFSMDTPAIYKGLLYISDLLGNLYAIETSEGNIKWVNKGTGKKAPLASKAPVELENLQLIRSPLVFKDKVYFSRRNIIYSLDYSTGKETWQAKIKEIVSSPISYSNEKMYVSDKKGSLYCFNPSTGKEIWTLNFNFPEGVNNPVIIGPNIYGTSEYTLSAVNPNNGKIKWKNDEIMGSNGYYSEIVGNKDAVFYIDQNIDTISAFNHKGKKLWESESLGGEARPIEAEPIIANDVIYSVSMMNISSLDIKKGKKIKQVKSKQPIFNKPFITSNGKLLLIVGKDLVCYN